MRVQISVYQGDVHRETKWVQPPCIIGRNREAGLCVPHPSVSRHHCVLLDIGGKLILRDCGSLNGTSVSQGKLIENDTPLRRGDIFEIVDIRFVVDQLEGVVPTQAVDDSETQNSESTEQYTEKNDADMADMANIADVVDMEDMAEDEEVIDLADFLK